MKQPKILITLMLVFCMFSLAYLVEAQSKPNVSGTWKMNAEKSKFEKGGPKTITIKFDHQDAKLIEAFSITNEQGERTLNFTYTLDGKEAAQEMGGQAITTIAKWEGNALILEFKNGQGFNFNRKINVSGDGKTMTIDVKQTNANGSVSDTVVLDKQ
jgi:hypothetical protein